MVYRKKKAVKKRPYKKRRQFKKPTFRQFKSYGIHPDPFPTKLRTRMKFADVYTLIGDGALAGYTGAETSFRCLSIHDPLYQIGGTTVVGHGIMALLYKRYQVTGCKIEVTFSDPSTDGMVVVASLNQEATVNGRTEKQLVEQSLTYTTELNNTGSQKHTMRFYVKPWALLGISKLEWMANKSTYTSLMANSPVDEVYFRLACLGPNPSGSSPPSIKAHVRLIYYTTLYERRQLESSVI